MDCKKSGALIRRLRLGKDMTQSALAEILGVSVQAVSKWERGLGYPDVSLINDLSSILGVDAKGAALRRAERKRMRLGQHEDNKILRLSRMRCGIHRHGKRGIFMLRQKA